ncbi:hypothetical protein DTO96_102391 [Ephemeroptericola cinctiostellae]|uniref:Phage late control D family protein n=1 Tax=Ephemeroptericola cinctiostellae TaxID=2268024 RepID=A0A345DE48_9BURK|nr:contractile injection system protein, VgrG/Pvc8 family [Ephemeroptericola cinctiostellae]AXF86636.1 hypothetical protein DTO96_102391 [Ephemeroptericola cinctiostellae]
MKPIVEIKVNGSPASALFNDRILSVDVTDEAGIHADSCTLTLDNRDHMLDEPPADVELEVFMGYAGQPLQRMGLFSVDEDSLSGGGTMTVSGKSADMVKTLKSQRNQSWKKTELGKILTEIAERNGLKPAIAEKFKKIVIEQLDQSFESDLTLMTRLADQYGALAKPASGYLVFVERGASVSATGEPLTVIDVDVVANSVQPDWSYTKQRREVYASVVAYWSDKKNAKQQEVKVGNGDPVYRIKKPFKNHAEAQAAAQAKYDVRLLGQYELSFEMVADLRMMAESPINASGFPARVNGLWVVKSVSTSFSDSGFSQKVKACRKTDFDAKESDESSS